jgi:hypothetical protein
VLSIAYQTDEKLNRIIDDEILRKSKAIAENRHCFIGGNAQSAEDPNQ